MVLVVVKEWWAVGNGVEVMAVRMVLTMLMVEGNFGEVVVMMVVVAAGLWWEKKHFKEVGCTR